MNLRMKQQPMYRPEMCRFLPFDFLARIIAVRSQTPFSALFSRFDYR